MSTDNNKNHFKLQVEIITIISFIFEIVRSIWTLFFMSESILFESRNTIHNLLVCLLLVIDAIVIAVLVFYFIGLIINKVSFMKPFKWNLELWLISCIISIILALIYFNEIQQSNIISKYKYYVRHNNYIASPYFSKRIPFYLCMIFNIISGCMYYWSAQKYDKLLEDENVSPMESQVDIKIQSQCQSDIKIQSDVQSPSDDQHHVKV